MRLLWPIERAVLEAAMHDYPRLRQLLEDQADVARVTEFENTGAGFFSTVTVGADAAPLPDSSTLDAACGTVDGIDGLMGFLVFVEDGRVSLIEGYCFGDACSTAVDFGHAQFDLEPWSSAERMLGS